MKNKVVLITGVSSGIGQSILKALATQEYIIVGTYNNHMLNNDFIEEILKINSNIFLRKVNLLNERDIKLFIDFMRNNFSEIHILINNAGYNITSPVVDMLANDWRNIMAINIDAPYLICKYCIPLMNKQNGKIFNISSSAGIHGLMNHSAYSASKGALITFTKALAKEVGKIGISVNCLCPGAIKTNINKDNEVALLDAKFKSLLKRDNYIVDFIEILLLLCSNKINSISGQVFVIDDRIY